jgi:hypothetical protein
MGVGGGQPCRQATGLIAKMTGQPKEPARQTRTGALLDAQRTSAHVYRNASKRTRVLVLVVMTRLNAERMGLRFFGTGGGLVTIEFLTSGRSCLSAWLGVFGFLPRQDQSRTGKADIGSLCDALQQDRAGLGRGSDERRSIIYNTQSPYLY